MIYSYKVAYLNLHVDLFKIYKNIVKKKSIYEIYI